MSSSQAVRTRHPKSVTRATILQKAYELYLNREITHGDERLSTVLDELGYTTGAGYQIWANQAAFRDDLQVYVAENIEYATLASLAGHIQELHSKNLSFDNQVLAGADLYIDMFLGREDFYLSLRFFAMAADRAKDITNALIQGYERLTWEMMSLFESVLNDHGRKMKAGLTLQDLAVATTALVEGYALRQRIQPDKLEPSINYSDGVHHVFSIAFLGVVREFTEELPSA